MKNEIRMKGMNEMPWCLGCGVEKVCCLKINVGEDSVSTGDPVIRWRFTFQGSSYSYSQRTIYIYVCVYVCMYIVSGEGFGTHSVNFPLKLKEQN